ncbi:MAG: type II toxin-antitoxin system HigB family toxin [Chromatiaceae bacterium]|jgi:mRNA interferase HigB|nr:type II toxin-antitoxin system HigB family toxin [Chromatiaceae bacterium]MCF7997180.1 type II toxin-antitoxin system HigB family toxin [Chromatiaceae bacterium]MCF8014282.1 type II toxin-antitoxin system HigB family toxin [Chromatiaceae bacterium]
MRVISKKPLRDFWQIHPESKGLLEDWFKKASKCEAYSFSQLRQTFGSADYVDGVTVFDVGGNRYRLAAVIHYDKQRLYVRHVMTHAEYDRNAWRKV